MKKVAGIAKFLFDVVVGTIRMTVQNPINLVEAIFHPCQKKA